MIIFSILYRSYSKFAAAAKSLVMSDSVGLHRPQPTRLSHPWDSPGKKTGVGLPFPSPMYESEKWKWRRSVVSDPQRPHGLQQPSRLLQPRDFPDKSIGVGCHCLLCTPNLATVYLLFLVNIYWTCINTINTWKCFASIDLFPSHKKLVMQLLWSLSCLFYM